MIYRGQLPDSKGMTGQYVEPAADVDAQSQINVKHDPSSKTINRSLLQRKVMVEGNDGLMYPITVNLTAIANKKHSADDIVKQINITTDAATDATFTAGFVSGLVA
jgi:hypothetical protein